VVATSGPAQDGAVTTPSRSISHATGPVEPPLPATTIDENLQQTVARYAGREAVVECATGRRLTYAELDAEVEALARGLVGRGVAKGDRVGIWAPNCLEWFLVQYATARIGAILVTVNPAYRTHELRYVLEQAGIGLLVSATAFKTSDYRAMVAAVGHEDVVFVGDPSWQSLLDGGQDLPAVTLRPDDPINIQYTSGTTGFPKGATLSHTNILGNGFFVGEGCGYDETDRICVPVPFYHCFGMVMGNLASTSHGACVVIPAPGFDPALTLQAVADEQCTSLYGVPTMFIAELALPDLARYDLSSLRTGIMAGSPCPAEVMKRVMGELNMPEVTIAYGMTETSPVSTQTRADDSVDRRVSTVGRVHPHLEVAVLDPVSRERVPIGETGELCTRGYSVMLGYWRDPERTAEVLSDGWMSTGDLATMDAEGYLAIVGRSKDMVIRGGENVYPREVEEFLYTHPDVLDAQVVGVPDERYGEELMAWIQLRAGAPELDAAAVREFCTGRLAHYKIPRYVRIVEEFPMTVTGKVRKVDMREESTRLLGL
jgi:fatty-acyl-CoA synthase